MKGGIIVLPLFLLGCVEVALRHFVNLTCELAVGRVGVLRDPIWVVVAWVVVLVLDRGWVLKLQSQVKLV